ncbi:MAG: 30S ribosomal protein S7 [Salibacteraceae bacterium]|jgi:small subunit ribosomal protein S7|nr:30S ribosomal protein S7 [Salibacteraceae bacterium]MDP4686605.1 30S ribosomal protein S7 [Salibacteraceae bacterium]MDP4764189.1 30S ribosomal protein S7 [Salibacteraceae bacterium]MDP4843293.1 30S ribosomal protein S7 [Salibacteraceae bacterium]MDP4935056.1 30S ribosomal protein S7 [Salibacteraceae bacterium]
MRKGRAKVRRLMPDPRFKSEMVTQFVNNLMLDGKKSVAYKIFYDAMDIVESKVEEGSLDTWKKALENVTPQVEVKSRRVGGATFQIPQEIRASRKLSMGMKWLISYSKKRNGKSMAIKLADEIVAASKEEGAAYKKKEDTHRMAEANKAFAHFRF